MIYNAHEIFSIGVTIEQNGQAFYTEALSFVQDVEFKRLFGELAEWEKRHIEIFEELKAKLPPENLTLDTITEDEYYRYLNAMARSHVFKDKLDVKAMVIKCSSLQDILNMALRFEKDSVALYVAMKECIPENLGKKSIDHLILEELKHIELLNHQLELFES